MIQIITEKDFTEQVRRAARVYGWMEYHTYNSKHSPSGFPDLVLVRLDGTRDVLVRELKVRSSRGKMNTPTDEQRKWLDAMQGKVISTGVWTPDSWDEIEATLREVL